jgi:hypothetical protein
MNAPLRRALLASVLVGVPLPPAARANHEAVTVARPEPLYASTDGLNFVVFALCRATATEDATWTKVWCEVDGTWTEIFMPDESPMGAGEPVWNVSVTQANGPAAVAVWEGGVKEPFRICAHAQAGWSHSDGTPETVVSDGPKCITIDV